VVIDNTVRVINLPMIASKLYKVGQDLANLKILIFRFSNPKN